MIDFDALSLAAARAGARPARRRPPAHPAGRRLPAHVRGRRGDHARRRGDRRPSRQARAGHAMSAGDRRLHRRRRPARRRRSGRTRVTAVKIPVSRYTSPEFFAREMVDVWPKTWQLACTVDHVANPGDWHEYRVGHLSVLIVRGDDGVLRAFQNVCLPPRQRAVQRVGHGPGRDPLPVPPLDVGTRRPAARGPVATRVRRAQRRLPAHRRAGRHVGPAGVREPRPRRRAARRVPRPGAGRDRVGEPRRVPRPGAHLGEGRLQLEDADRGLQRDVPRAGHPPRDAGHGRRRQRPAGRSGRATAVWCSRTDCRRRVRAVPAATTTCSRRSSR